MKKVSEMFNPKELEELIAHIEERNPEAKARFASGSVTLQEVICDSRLKALKDATQRLAQIKAEIGSGLRSETGELNVRV